MGQVLQPEPGGQDDKQTGNQQHTQIFFEFDDVPDAGQALIGQDDAHKSDGKETRLFLNHIRGGEGPQSKHQGEAILQLVGDPIAPEQQNQQSGAQPAQN